MADGAYARAIGFVAIRLGGDFYGAGLPGADGAGVPFAPPPSLPAPPPGLSALQYYGTSLNLGLVGAQAGADTVTLSIDFRTGLGNTNPGLLARTTRAAALFQAEAAYAPGVGSHYDPIYHSGEHPVMKLATRSYREALPDRPAELPYAFFSPGTTYLKVVTNFVNFGPVDLYLDPTVDRFHEDDERISIDSLKTNITLFAHVLQTLIQADPSPVAPK